MKKILLLVIVGTIQACAFTDATLPINHSADATFNAPLGQVDSFQFSLSTIEDVREDKNRIGWKKNGYGQNTADITTLTPITEIVANGIAAGFTANKHTLAESGSKVTIKGTVNRFWFEFKPNFFTVEFIGEVRCHLDFINTETGEVFYQNDYAGSNSETSGGGLEKKWTLVMNRALDKLIEDVIFDESLIEALEEL